MDPHVGASGPDAAGLDGYPEENGSPLNRNIFPPTALFIEEGTPFYTFYGGEKPTAGHPPLPDEETDRLMYSQTKAYLAEAGYGRYEISNYARPGFSLPPQSLLLETDRLRGLRAGGGFPSAECALEQYIGYEGIPVRFCS